MPEVTVILPVHNGANYLKESIESIRGQTFDDFELHILDDDSSDRTPEIAQSTEDRRVRYSRNPERFGLFRTLNRGFTEAQSAWVRIWAHDDRMLPIGLGKFVNFARAHPQTGMVYCDFFEIDASGQRTRGEEEFVEQRRRTPEISFAKLSALLFFAYGCLPGNISTVMIRQDAWRSMGGFLEGIQQAPDYDMWVRLSQRFPVGFIREKLVELRSHPLQLGRLGHKQMTTIEEEWLVHTQLCTILKEIVPSRDLQWYWRKHRGREHIHWIARALLRRDFGVAARGWRAVSRYGQPWLQTWSWLTSINGRFFRADRERFFDSSASLCLETVPDGK